MPKSRHSVNSLKHSGFTADSNDNSSITQVSQTPTTDNDGWFHARKFLNNNGNIDIAVDGSVTPVEYSLSVAANEMYLVYSLEVVFTDNGNINQLADFMSINGGLTNGIVVTANLANPTPVVTVKTNYGLINRLKSNIEIKNVGSDSIAVGEITFASPVIVDGSLGHTITATINDDLTPLLLSTISTTGVVKLDTATSLISQSGQTFIEDFSSDDGHVYDSGKAVFESGQVSQVKAHPDASFFASYSSDSDGTWGDGTLTATESGSPVVSGGLLQMTTGGIQHVTYTPTIVYNGTLAVRLVYRPNYSGDPADYRPIFGGAEAVSSYNNRILLQHQTNGQIQFRVNDGTGSTVFRNETYTWAPTSGQDYEFEINIDVVNGDSSLFIDGVQVIGPLSNTAVCTTLGAIALGNDISVAATEPINGSYDYLMVFNEVQHSAPYTPGAPVSETTYSETLVTMPTKNYEGLGNIVSFQSVSAVSSGNEKYIINGNWFNGAAWVVSNDTYAQANTIAEINANIASMTATNSVIIDLVLPGSNTQANVDNFTLTYTGQTLN